MIPLRDQVSSRRMPFITVLLIVINIYIFLKEVMLNAALDKFIYKYAVIPAYYLKPQAFNLSSIIDKNITLVSSLFLHGSWLHLIGNMWYLWIFGDNVEDRLGHFRFLVFYILCGVTGNLAHVFINGRSTIPALGASGCIAGVLGAYFLLFPRARIVTLLPIFIFWTVAEVPAFFFLGIWFLIQFLNGYFMLPFQDKGSCIAWWAHIGGFISGIILTIIFAVKGNISRKR